MIHLFCPSRGRPRQAGELLDSFVATRSMTTQVRLIFLLDHDDPTASSYRGQKILGAPTGDPTGPLNRAALATEAEGVGFCGDDTRFETQGWDEMVLLALEQDPSVAWGDDGHDIPWPSTVFMSTSISRALGYMVPPTLRRGFFDVAWMLLAGGLINQWGQITMPPINIARVLPSLMFRHVNLPAGHPDGPSAQTIEQDERSYNEWLKRQMPRDRKKILDLAFHDHP